MKESLLSLDPAPEPEAAEETALPPSSPALRMQHSDDPSLSESEPLIDPFALSAPRAAPAKRRAPRVPVTGMVLSFTGTAILLIGILLGMKLSDYFHGRYFEQRFSRLFDMPDLPPGPATVTPELTVAATPSPSLASEPLPSRTSAAPPSAPDFGGELEALRQERQLVSQRFEQLNSPGGAASAPAAPSPMQPAARPETQLPSARSPLGDLLASAPSNPQLTPEQIRVRDAPAIAHVRQYDADWHFVVLDGGKERNIAEGTQLAVRRGHEILGLIKVDEVLENESVAELVGTWRTDAQATKPLRGDDIVTYPLF